LVCRLPAVGASLHVQALDGLPGDLGYYLEVLIAVQDCEPGSGAPALIRR
jgi:hypothetical protein